MDSMENLMVDLGILESLPLENKECIFVESFDVINSFEREY